MDKTTISVTLVYSRIAREVIETVLELPSHSTVQDALDAAKPLAYMHDEMAQTEPTHAFVELVGILGKKVALNQVLQDQDRIELYRQLRVDPKVARRERFQKQGARTTGLFAKTRSGGKAGY
jgi:putative ubiquitin-RnfH superfamily antitoxin RatB of RatAB toxin-antitoxin module